MNITESQKHAIIEKLRRQRENEHISNTDAGRNLGIPANYVSMMCNPEQWEKCPAWAWNKVNTWYNSGQKLSEYSTAHAAVSPRQAEELKPEVKKVLVQETKEALKKEAEYIKQQMKKEFENQTLAEGLGRAKEELIREAANISTTAPLAVESVLPEPGQQFTDTARLKVALDIEINLVVNGQKVQVR